MTFWHWLAYLTFLALATGAVCWLTEWAEDRAHRDRWVAEYRRHQHVWEDEK